MRWFALVAASALVLVSGCLGEPAAPPVEADVGGDDGPDRVARQGRGSDREDDEDEEEEERSGKVTRRSFADEFSLQLTSVDAVFRIGSIQGYNCAAVEGAPYRILNGTATLSWTPQSALTDSLGLEIRTYYGDDVHETGSGPSPLVVEFRDIEVEEDRDLQDFLTFGVHLDGPAGASYEQDVTMALSFEYESDADVDASRGYC
jgi:hypothetical protein